MDWRLRLACFVAGLKYQCCCEPPKATPHAGIPGSGPSGARARAPGSSGRCGPFDSWSAGPKAPGTRGREFGSARGPQRTSSIESGTRGGRSFDGATALAKELNAWFCQGFRALFLFREPPKVVSIETTIVTATWGKLGDTET